MRPLTRAQSDPLTRARRALDQVDGELDLARLHAVTSEHDRPDPDLFPVDDAAGSQVEILRSGQQPTQPRRRAAFWALAASVALLCGAGAGTAMLWSGADETPPGSQVPASPRPEVTAPPRRASARPHGRRRQPPRANPGRRRTSARRRRARSVPRTGLRPHPDACACLCPWGT